MLSHLVPSFSKLTASTIVGNMTATSKTFGYLGRDRLLAQLLQMIEHAGGIDDNLRHLAKQFADNVAYEGYGAGALSYHFS